MMLRSRGGCCAESRIECEPGKVSQNYGGRATHDDFVHDFLRNRNALCKCRSILHYGKQNSKEAVSLALDLRTTTARMGEHARA